MKPEHIWLLLTGLGHYWSWEPWFYRRCVSRKLMSRFLRKNKKHYKNGNTEHRNPWQKFLHEGEQKIRWILDKESSRELICPYFLFCSFWNGNIKTYVMVIGMSVGEGKSDDLLGKMERDAEAIPGSGEKSEIAGLTLVIERKEGEQQMEVGGWMWVLVLVECLFDDSIL